jgi:hypothetical protein
MKQELLALRQASKPVVWMLQNGRSLSVEAHDEIGSIAGTLRAWILQRDRPAEVRRGYQTG